MTTEELREIFAQIALSQARNDAMQTKNEVKYSLHHSEDELN